MKRHYLLLSGFVFLVQPAVAAFKCVDKEGNITFSQQACPTTETSSEVNVEQGLPPPSGRTPGDSRACELAGLYAQDAAQRMRAGLDYEAEVARFGGTHGAKAPVVALVNYVHSFNKGDAAAGRIAVLARAKCQTGGFGPLAFEDLPVSEYYAFDENRDDWVRRGAPAVSREGAAPLGGELQGSHGVSGSGARKGECEQAMAGLEGLLGQMGSSEAEKAKLRQQLSDSCK